METGKMNSPVKLSPDVAKGELTVATPAPLTNTVPAVLSSTAAETRDSETGLGPLLKAVPKTHRNVEDDVEQMPKNGEARVDSTFGASDFSEKPRLTPAESMDHPKESLDWNTTTSPEDCAKRANSYYALRQASKMFSTSGSIDPNMEADVVAHNGSGRNRLHETQLAFERILAKKEPHPYFLQEAPPAEEQQGKRDENVSPSAHSSDYRCRQCRAAQSIDRGRQRHPHAFPPTLPPHIQHLIRQEQLLLRNAPRGQALAPGPPRIVHARPPKIARVILAPPPGLKLTALRRNRPNKQGLARRFPPRPVSAPVRPVMGPLYKETDSTIIDIPWQNDKVDFTSWTPADYAAWVYEILKAPKGLTMLEQILREEHGGIFVEKFLKRPEEMREIYGLSTEQLHKLKTHAAVSVNKRTKDIFANQMREYDRQMTAYCLPDPI